MHANAVVRLIVLVMVTTGSYWGDVCADDSPMASAKKLASVEVMAERLRERLENTGGDMKGWLLLARSYHHLKRWDAAAQAFSKAKALGYEGEPAPLPEQTQNVNMPPQMLQHDFVSSEFRRLIHEVQQPTDTYAGKLDRLLNDPHASTTP